MGFPELSEACGIESAVEGCENLFGLGNSNNGNGDSGSVDETLLIMLGLAAVIMLLSLVIVFLWCKVKGLQAYKKETLAEEIIAADPVKVSF